MGAAHSLQAQGSEDFKTYCLELYSSQSSGDDPREACVVLTKDGVGEEDKVSVILKFYNSQKTVHLETLVNDSWATHSVTNRKTGETRYILGGYSASSSGGKYEVDNMIVRHDNLGAFVDKIKVTDTENEISYFGY